MALAVLSGAALGMLLLVLSRPLLEMMGCPADVVGGAQLYLNIYAVGLPASLVYNYGAAILRAVGDTKRPLYYLTVSGLFNVVLNVALVAGLRLGVAGVAIATVVSETISAASCSPVSSPATATFALSRKDAHRAPRSGDDPAHRHSAGCKAACSPSPTCSFSPPSIPSARPPSRATHRRRQHREGLLATTVSNSISQAALTFSSQNIGGGEICPRSPRAARLPRGHVASAA